MARTGSGTTLYIVRFERRGSDGIWKRGYARTRRKTEQEALEAVQQTHYVNNKRNRSDIQYRNYRVEVAPREEQPHAR